LPLPALPLDPSSFAISPKSSAFLAAFLIVSVPSLAEVEFTRTLARDEFASAGLDKLTTAELTRLNELVQRQAAQPSPNRKSADPGPAKATQSRPAWVDALVTLERSARRPDATEAMESRLTGSFTGWTGRSTFRLENGQLWGQVNGDRYDYAPTLQSPKVKITPASFGSYWMEIETVNQRCRVKPVKLD
jgi:hypothetical protein